MPRRLLSLAILLSGAALCAPPAQSTLLSLAAGPTVAQVQAQIPPVPPGLARVWFLRQYEPGETLQTPMIYVNGQNLTSSIPGTAFYRDFAPGQYTFSVETCTRDVNQSARLDLTPGTVTDVEVQSLQSMQSYGCLTPMNFYARVIPPRWAQLYATQLTYLGAR